MARGHRSNEDFTSAAAAIVAASGWAALTPATLSASLGVHATAVYRHFPTWNDLIVSVFDLGLTQILGEAIATTPPDATPREQILSIIRMIRAAADADPYLVDCLYLALSSDTPLHTPNFDAMSAHMAQLLTDMGVPETRLPAIYQALESLSIGNLLVDFTGHPHHISNRRQRRRMSGITAFESFTRSDEATKAVADEAFELNVRLLLDECERAADQAR